MTRRKRLLTAAVVAAALTAPVAVVSANHVRIEAPVVPGPVAPPP